MKKWLSLLLMLFCTSLTCYGQGAAYTLDRTRHDFGELSKGKTYTATFELKSSGSEPLVLIDALTGCKCTKVTFPRKPLRKGHKATITVTFSADEVGAFDKLILVRTNAPDVKAKMSFRVFGTVKK